MGERWKVSFRKSQMIELNSRILTHLMEEEDSMKAGDPIFDPRS